MFYYVKILYALINIILCMKKIFLVILALLIISPLAALASPAGEDGRHVTDIYFFYGDGCPHCAKEEMFLAKLKEDRGEEVQIHYYEVWNNRDNAKLLQEVSKLHPMSLTGIPIVLIGDQHIVGFQDEATTGQRILFLINACEKNDLDVCPAKEILDAHPSDRELEIEIPDVVEVIDPNQNSEIEIPDTGDGANLIDDDGDSKLISDLNFEGVTSSDRVIKIPFLGEKNVNSFSLPALSVVLGVLDGFNPCAMWVLIFLISPSLYSLSEREMTLSFTKHMSAILLLDYFCNSLIISSTLNP